MYTESAQTAGHQRLFQHKSGPPTTPCPCQRCVHYEPPHGHHGGGLGYQQTDHPSLDCRRDVQAPQVKTRAFLVDRVERSGHHSPQRRPVFVQPGPYGHSEDLSQVCPWDFNPAQWSYALDYGARHCPCVSVVHGDTRAHTLKLGTPHPLPHLQFKGQGYRHRRTVRYVSVDEEEEGCECTHHAERGRGPHLTRLPNGHCGPRPVLFEGGEERDNHQDWSQQQQQQQQQQQGGSEEAYNGPEATHKAFFPTEVPQKQLNQSRRKGPRTVPPSGEETSKLTNNSGGGEHQHQGSEDAKPKRREDSVRDQIRQVVAGLEDVLGGLKRVHVEMKEVVEQIDRLTANIDLSEEAACTGPGLLDHFDGSAPSGDTRMVLLTNHKPAPVQEPQHDEEDRIILRTNAPSPVYMASVVKTSRFTPPTHSKNVNHERPGLNGHAPPWYPHTQPEPLPQSLDPKVIVGNSTSTSRTQKPPPYPQNGRCGKGSHPPPKAARTPAYPGRGRQSTSMV